MSLFRAEVLDTRDADRLAAALIVIPHRLNLLIGLFLLAVLAGGLWLLATPYQATVTVPGYTEAPLGIVPILASGPGQVYQTHVAEGEWVAAGARLITLDGPVALREGRVAAASRRHALERSLLESTARHERHLQLEQRESDQLLARKSNLQHRLDLVDQQSTLSRAGLEPLSERLLGLSRLGNRGLVARTEVDGLRRQRFVEQQGLLELRQTRLELLAEQNAVQAARANAEDRAVIRKSEYRQEHQRLLADLAALQHQTRTVLVAPVRGQVTFLQATPGTQVGNTKPLLTLVPPMQTHDVWLLLPARTLGEIRVGQRLRLRYQAFPKDIYGMPEGEVAELSRAPLLPGQLSAPVLPSESVYRARIQLDESDPFGVPVTPGMPVTAEVVTRSAAIGRWLLDPLQALWSSS